MVNDMYLKSFLIFILFVAIAILSCCGNQETEVLVTDDGPHVYLQDDTSATVIYLCNDSVITQKFFVSDTLKFHGFCDDSAAEYIIPLDNPKNDTEIYDNVSRIYVLSDIHGEYEYLVDNLITNHIIDNSHNWIWGDGHLVINGDIFDRGDMVTEILWLIYSLEQQAAQTGGAVHFILGNHEIMVMQGDNRYVNDKYLKGICKKTRIKHEDLYGPYTALGRWLRTKNTAIKINNIMFVHGGIGPDLIDSGMTIARLNNISRYGLTLNSMQYSQNDSVKYLFKSYGPFWYRGYHYEMEDRYSQITEAQVDRELDFYQASAIVVGHTEIDSLSGLYSNKIFAVDIPFDELNGLEGLLIEDGKFYRVKVNGTRILLRED